MWTIDVADAVKALIKKAKETHQAYDALQFSQAACNVAHARATMMATFDDTRAQSKTDEDN